MPRSIETSRTQRQSKYSLLQHIAMSEIEGKPIQTNKSLSDMVDGHSCYAMCKVCKMSEYCWVVVLRKVVVGRVAKVVVAP